MHFLGIYKHKVPLFEAELVSSLACIEYYIPNFFPIFIEVGRKKQIVFQHAHEFELGKLPDDYWIDKNELVRIEINSVNVPAIVTALLNTNTNPGIIPSNLLIKWDHQKDLPETGALVNLLCDLSDIVNADYAFVTDEETRYDDHISDRFHKVNPASTPFGVFWITWFGKNQLDTLGKKINKLEEAGFFMKKSKQGKVLLLKEEVFNEAIDKKLRLNAEDLIKLDEL